jgi:hypothetical protein
MRAVAGNCAKAAQAGFSRRGSPRPRKPRRCFGGRSPLVGLGHKSRRTHSLKGIVPEVAAYGGGVAQETPPTRSPVPVPQLVYGSKRNDFRAIPGNTLGTVVDSDLSRGDPGDGRTNFEVAGPGSFWNDFWSHHETVARPASRRGRGAGR